MQATNVASFLYALNKIFSARQRGWPPTRAKTGLTCSARVTMSIHENLLRLHRRQLDERRRYTAELEALSERLRADLGLLTAAIALEAAALEHPPESQGDNRSLAPKLRERHTKLEHSVAEL